ncbi:MAG: FG-GAP-like repeat-containing protein [Solirubrobacterales bacterium]|nr:FG-GAP-like repeat-containing protein [Solirubrobacterales bacterium]
MNLRSGVVSLIVFATVLALPQAASALKFTPAAGSPITNSGNVITMSAVGDFNQDGFDDIAFVGDGTLLRVKFGSARPGTFTSVPTSPNDLTTVSIPGVSSLSTIRSGDFDGDGHLDLLVGSGTSWGTVLGDGTGGFTQSNPSFQIPWAMPNYRGIPNDYANTIGDVDSDGDLDLVVGMYETGIDVALNDGDGDFTPQPVTYFLPEADRAANGLDGMYSPTLGDFNGDGKVDLAVALRQDAPPSSAPTGVYVANGDGAGNFTPSGEPPLFSDRRNFSSLSSLRLDPGTTDDLAVAFTDDLPDGTNLVTVLGGSNGRTKNPSLAGQLNAGYYPYQQSIGDFDSDGRPDILIGARGDYSASVIRNGGDGTITSFSGSPFLLPQIDGNNFSVNGIYSGDFDGDGALDIAADSSHSGQAFQARGIDVLLSQPNVTVDQTALGFGDVEVGTSGTLSVTLTNDGAPTATLGDVSITGPDAGQFTLGTTTCGSDLAGGASCDRAVVFSPTVAGSSDATLRIQMPGGSSVEVGLSGAGMTPVSPVKPAKLTLKLTGAKKVKRGKTLVVKAQVGNTGGKTAQGVTLKTKLPKKMAKAVKPVKVGDLAPGQRVARKIRIRVKKNAPAGRKFKVKVTASAGTGITTVKATQTFRSSTGPKHSGNPGTRVSP